ncbi:Ras association domain-containing protein 1 [Schistosoma japonicum]|nr:Ras association domain-containing protein 1 [Schistosoma japonicum]KAH8859866.1 Ras association domain-containing protein 1 [Schistosoma japonicum]
MNATKIVYRCRRSFKGLTISDSLDLATNRTQSSLYSNLPPESIELDLICADKIFSNKGSSRNGHLFCPVPLDGDTFCDHCNQPIWELGWRPVCFKCAKCHMTCHWLCKDEVAVVCDDDAKTIKHASEVVPLFPKIVPEHNEQKVESTVFELSASLENDSTDCVPCEGILANNHLTSESDISPLDTSLNDLNEMNSPVENLIDHVPSERFAPQSISSSLGQHTFTTTDCSTQLDVSAKMDCGTPTKLKVESLLPPTLSRRATDCYKSKKSVGVKLVTRHSFLCGNKPNVCLAYDFSSLDKEAIRDRGIFVRHLSPSLNELQNTSEPLQSTNLISDISNFDTLVLSNERSISKPEVSDIGLASVIQTTQEFIRTKPKRSFQTHLLSSTTLPLIPMVVGPRSVLPWSSDRLKQLVQIFSMNEFGLQAANLTGSDSCDCEGQVRVHINLLRPIQMLLTARPASIFDVVSSKSGERNDDSEDDEDEDEDVSNGIENDQCLRLTQCENDNNYSTVSHSFIPTANIPNLPSNVDRVYKAERNIIGSHHRLCRTASKVSTFRLPRGSTKVLHVRLSTTAQMVICALLDRFGIQDNPQKFALYEHTIEGDQKVSVRKLFDDESPLGLLFKWADQDPDNFNNTLGVKRLVLQENETGDIEWTTFSLSELYTFLGILNREESDYRRRIELKYEIRKKEIKRLMELHNNKLKSLDMSKHDQFDSNISNGTSVITEQCENEIVTNQSFRNSESNVYCCTDSMSAPVSPTLFRKRNEQIDSKDEKASSPRVSNSPDSCSSPEATLHPNTIKHGLLSNVVSTLPRTPTSKISEISNSNKLPSIFKTFSNFKAKKAVLAQQKRLAKIEKARVKAEQQKEQVKGHSHSPWKWRGFGTLSPSSSSSLSPHLPSHQ